MLENHMKNKNRQLDLLVCEQIQVLAKPCPTDSYIIQFKKVKSSSYKKKKDYEINRSLFKFPRKQSNPYLRSQIPI